jgi:hypothetical protein
MGEFTVMDRDGRVRVAVPYQPLSRAATIAESTPGLTATELRRMVCIQFQSAPGG